MKISTDSAYRDIRRGTFPFPTEIISGRIHVSARAIGLIVDPTANEEEAQDQDQSLAAAA